MADRKGECCIARWGGGGHMAAGEYNTSKMDMIMLKFRPIAPKPVAATAAVSGTSESSGSGDRHAKAAASIRGRKKTNNNSGSSSNNTISNRRCTRKRKSSSPENKKRDNKVNHEGDRVDQKKDLTLLPLFPEAPDLSPTNYSYDQVIQEHNSNMEHPFWEKNGNSPDFERNYNHCHANWW